MNNVHAGRADVVSNAFVHKDYSIGWY